ncbi:hypothetical protein T265_02380 [Opisthorchis viverrini]|uniref:Uncharacterized protein n=1 Tax=Opisthorchis viverrini TaxID=6198 RepID=A0A074ZZ90_OPIVI|nr:hypothetical protein T265_02380 [Opisthorchis viverrini]KER31322.1 hypothetical protein T265_02380 [Opisthorchis viverrini]
MEKARKRKRNFLKHASSSPEWPASDRPPSLKVDIMLIPGRPALKTRSTAGRSISHNHSS